MSDEDRRQFRRGCSLLVDGLAKIYIAILTIFCVVAYFTGHLVWRP